MMEEIRFQNFVKLLISTASVVFVWVELRDLQKEKRIEGEKKVESYNLR